LGRETERIIAAVKVILQQTRKFPVITLFTGHEKYWDVQWSCYRLYRKFLSKN